MKSLEEVEKEFVSKIEIPKNKPERQFFFCPVGLVGAGKTTITKPIAKKLNLVRISTDELRKILKENGYDYSHLRNIISKVAIEFDFDGYSIAFDMDCGNFIAKEFIEALALPRLSPIFWIEVKAKEEFIFEKFRNHKASWLADNPEVMIENYKAQKQKRKEENTHFDYFYKFDTSKENLDEQIEKCINKIEKHLAKN